MLYLMGSWERCSGNNWHLGVLSSSVQRRCIKHTAHKSKGDQITLVLLFTEQIVERISNGQKLAMVLALLNRDGLPDHPKSKDFFDLLQLPAFC